MMEDRWFFDQMRDGMATIRLRPDAHSYEVPEIVKQALMTAQNEPDEDTCPTCGQYVSTCSGCGGPITEHDED